MQLQLSLAVADRLHETLLVRGEPLDAVEAVRLLLASPTAPEPICRRVLAALVLHDRRFCPERRPATCFRSGTGRLPDPDLADVPFVALDLETTGLAGGHQQDHRDRRGADRGLPGGGHVPHAGQPPAAHPAR